MISFRFKNFQFDDPHHSRFNQLEDVERAQCLTDEAFDRLQPNDDQGADQ